MVSSFTPYPLHSHRWLIDITRALDTELPLSQDEAYELLRHLEEIYTRAEQGAGADYLGALDHIMQGPDVASDRVVDVDSALAQLQVVRLALARYLARCAVGGSRLS